MADPAAGRALSPTDALLEITGKCNLRCSYCFHFDSSTEGLEDLPTWEWLRFIDELQSLSVFRVALSGGEPFIRQDILELCRHIAGSRMRFSILSNGGLITEHHAAELASIGRGTVQISLDGVGAVNDAARGAGSFDAATRGIRLLQRYKIPTVARVTLGHHNKAHFEETIDYIYNDLGMRTVSTGSAIIFDANSKDYNAIQLSLKDFADTIKAHLRIIKKYPDLDIRALSGPYGVYKEWRRIYRAMKLGKGSRFGGCHAVCTFPYNRIGVRTDGGIVACSSFPDRVLGRINRDSLADVWLNDTFLQELRDLRRKPLADYPRCSACRFRPWCVGGCPATLAQCTEGGVVQCAAAVCLRQFTELFPAFAEEFLEVE